MEEEKDARLSWTDWDTVEISSFEHVEEPWRVTGDHYENSIRVITDRVIDNYRKREPGRLVVHYLRPHVPYRSNALDEGRPLHDYERDPWAYLKNGGEFANVWEAYLDDLQMVLDEIKLILRNIDADVILTSDHGDMFGEFGYLYSHPPGFFHPAVRKVPLVNLDARNIDAYEPSHTEPITEETGDVEEHLRKLGYLE
jgi:arylsulfatase A-like enzyme